MVAGCGDREVEEVEKWKSGKVGRKCNQLLRDGPFLA
jgi:hypothetical protein